MKSYQKYTIRMPNRKNCDGIIATGLCDGNISAVEVQTTGTGYP